MAEVTDDERFTGGALARTDRETLAQLLTEHHVDPAIGRTPADGRTG